MHVVRESCWDNRQCMPERCNRCVPVLAAANPCSVSNAPESPECWRMCECSAGLKVNTESQVHLQLGKLGLDNPKGNACSLPRSLSLLGLQKESGDILKNANGQVLPRVTLLSQPRTHAKSEAMEREGEREPPKGAPLSHSSLIHRWMGGDVRAKR